MRFWLASLALLLVLTSRAGAADQGTEEAKAIVRKATAQDPEGRYRTALEMASACGVAADALADRKGAQPVASDWIRWFDQPREVPRPSLWSRLTGWARR